MRSVFDHSQVVDSHHVHDTNDSVNRARSYAARCLDHFVAAGNRDVGVLAVDNEGLHSALDKVLAANLSEHQVRNNA